jgi:hypothetical protein
VSIKRGDRLVMTIKGVSEPVVALLDEFDGSVMIRLRGGATGKRSVKILRADGASPVVPPANPVRDDGADLSAVHAPCPVCRETNVTATVASADNNLRVLRVRLVCAHAHEWEVELPQPPRTS